MQVRRAATREGISLKIDPGVIQRIVELSGGHPHILQLLGSHVVEHEDEDPDGIIDPQNLLGSLQRICYEDRANVYISTLHNLELHNKLDTLRSLLGLSPEFSAQLLLPGFPTKINRTLAKECVPPEDIQWLIDNNILSIHSDDHYGLLDEFLRIRMIFDQVNKESEQEGWEKQLILGFAGGSYFSRREMFRRREEEGEAFEEILDDFDDEDDAGEPTELE